MTHVTINRWCRARSTTLVARVGVHCFFVLTIALLQHCHSIQRGCGWVLDFLHRHRRRLSDRIENVCLRLLLASPQATRHCDESMINEHLLSNRWKMESKSSYSECRAAALWIGLSSRASPWATHWILLSSAAPAALPRMPSESDIYFSTLFSD